MASVEYVGGLRTEATHLKSANKITTDAPIDNLGKGEAFSPTDLVSAALSSCMMTIMGQVAEREGIVLNGLKSEVTKVMVANPKLVIIMFAGRSDKLTNAFVTRFKAALIGAGVAPADLAGRVKMLPATNHNDYKRINQACDFMLDTLYWSGGNTSLDAIAQGLPIVTLPSTQMRGRQTMAMLNLLGVPALIAEDGADYVRIATKLATDTAWRKGLAAKIVANDHAIFADDAPIKALEMHLQSWVLRD